MELIHSRFQVLDAPIVAPGKCTVCGSSDTEGRKYIDFGMQLDWFGAVYFCTECLIEVAALLGLKNTEAYDIILDGLREQISILEQKFTRQEEEINASRLLLRNCICHDVNTGGGDSDFVSVAVEESESNDGSSSDSDESGGFEGFDDIPEPPDFDEPESKPKRARGKSSRSE